MTSNGMRWEDPPIANRHKWGEIIDQLKTKPGKYLLVVDDEPVAYAGSVAYKSLKPKGAEVTTRQSKGRMSVWARWPK